MKKQHTFPQRVGALIEAHIIKTERLLPNRRQQTKGYYDAYNSDGVYEIKAAKDDNYFRIMQKNHKLLSNVNGEYILIRYHLTNNDRDLVLNSNIIIDSTMFVKATELQKTSKAWLEDQRKQNLFYKVKI